MEVSFTEDEGGGGGAEAVRVRRLVIRLHDKAEALRLPAELLGYPRPGAPTSPDGALRRRRTRARPVRGHGGWL
jgi:hypothetical protein